jgi:hypothetical protein
MVLRRGGDKASDLGVGRRANSTRRRYGPADLDEKFAEVGCA